MRRTVVGVLAALVAAAATGCEDTEVVRTVTVTTPSETTAAATPSPSPTARLARAKLRPRRRAATPKFVYCDPNIRARAETTTCEFAQNTFYEYWTSGQAESIDVYSPTSGITYATRCAALHGSILCEATDGGAVRFSQASVDAYSQSQANRYAASHETRPAQESYGDGGYDDYSDDGSYDGYHSASEDPDFCDAHDCIPNYDEGRGYTVQCADGTYSRSGGIRGACSHHGGVG